MVIKDDFVGYIICDSDDNNVQIGGPYDHPDEAYRDAVQLVTKVWSIYDVATIFGRLEHEGREKYVPILHVMRAGPPGSTRVRLVHPSFPWLEGGV